MIGAERVVGAVGGLRLKTGMFSSKSYTLVFTDQRLVFAELTALVQKAHAEGARAAVKAAGGGFLRQLGAPMLGPNPYLAMDVASILAETAGNFAVGASEISRLKVGLDNGGEDDSPSLKLVVETRGRKFELSGVNATATVSEVRALAGGLVGDRAR